LVLMMAICHNVRRMTGSPHSNPSQVKGCDTHLGSIAVCIVDTGIVALVQPLKDNRERGQERQGHLPGRPPPPHTPPERHRTLSPS
jgi:hypothetical protein